MPLPLDSIPNAPKCQLSTEAQIHRIMLHWDKISPMSKPKRYIEEAQLR